MAAALAPGGAVAAAIPAFEPRPAQQALAAAVARTFADGGTLLAEAGTGTGKTLAYLVPAILSGHRVLISTGTKNLQEQIYFKDLPLLRDALGVPFTAAYMKGRGNYLCLHRFEAWRDSGLIRTFAETQAIRAIEEWSRETETGDRAELEDLQDDAGFWSDISAAAENCLGAECPRFDECFVTRMRQRAAASDVVIVNHHLLCADAAVRQNAYGEVIPSCERAVIDEAHQLEDVATQYFGRSASNFRVDTLARDLDRAASSAMIADRDKASDLRQDVVRLRDCARGFFSVLQLLRPSSGGGPATDSRLRLRPADTARAAEEGLALVSALEAVEADIALARDLPEDVLALARRSADLRDDLTFLLRADDSAFVYFLETRGRGVHLRASPIDVSEIVREVLLEELKTLVLTSATLTAEGSFKYVRDRLGITEAEEIRLDSEFDYARQSILYLPRNMPDPRSPAFTRAAAREVVEILKRTEGRAFVLFTSYANLRDVRAVAEAELEYPILVQGTAPRSALLRDFKATPHAVLLATSSFWQGVDVAGEALSCVIIDKLPFASPGDPIVAARIEAINGRGGSAFGEYQIPLAVLTLKQGLGRLLRHRADRGVLAVLDPRLRTMGYGRRFLASLPPAPVTHSLADVARFFAWRATAQPQRLPPRRAARSTLSPLHTHHSRLSAASPTLKTEVAMGARLRGAWLAGLIAVGLTMTGAPVDAQTGQIKGRVADAKDQPVEKAEVTIEAIDGMGRKFRVTTDRRGQYVQIGVPPGQYRVTVTKDGLSDGRELRIGLDPTDANFTLRPGGGAGGGNASADDKKKAEARIAAIRTNFDLGVKLSNEGNHDEAIAKFNEVLKEAPKCVECFTNIASIQMAKKDYDAAEASYKQAIAINPSSAEAYNGLATLYNAQKKFDQAAEASGQAAKLGAAAPGGANATTMFNQGIIAWNASRIPDAKKAFEETVRLDPKHAEAHYWLGMANLNEGKMPEAAEHFETYLKLEPAGKYADQAKGILPQLKK